MECAGQEKRLLMPMGWAEVYHSNSLCSRLSDLQAMIFERWSVL
jgi:hypothetical protein